MKLKWLIGTAVVLLLVALFVTSDLYPAAWLRWRVGLAPPVTATAEQIQTLDVIKEPPQYWVFYYFDGQLQSELEYQSGGLLTFIPTHPKDWVEVYSSAPFSGLSVRWDEWDALVNGTLRVEFWRSDGWDKFGRSFTMGRVPAGPAEERGYQITWGCYQWQDYDLKPIPGYGALGYALRFRTGVEMPAGQAVHTTIRSCMPEWETHPDYAVALVQHVDPCDNLGGHGWSGKVLQVWVEDTWGQPVQGVEVRFGTESSFGVAYDRPDVGGLTSRFGLIEWDHYGISTRYWICVEDFCIGNVRADLGCEYCVKGGRVTSYRPPNRPGRHSWKVRIVVRDE